MYFTVLPVDIDQLCVVQVERGKTWAFPLLVYPAELVAGVVPSVPKYREP